MYLCSKCSLRFYFVTDSSLGLKVQVGAWHQWLRLTPVILATSEADIRFKARPGKWFSNPISKTPNTKRGWWSGSSGRIPV
jgi:hypothetical protein